MHATRGVFVVCSPKTILEPISLVQLMYVGVNVLEEPPAFPFRREKMERSSSESFVVAYQITRCHAPEDGSVCTFDYSHHPKCVRLLNFLVVGFQECLLRCYAT
jgi:hypothetical protein